MNQETKFPVKRGFCIEWNRSFIFCGVAAIGVPLVISSAKAGTATIEYGYDSAGRLISAATSGQGATTYAYDPAGNRLQRSFSVEADADHDGLVTALETALGLDPADPDTDHDGINDGAEVTAGTDGRDPASRVFAITSAAVVAGGAMEIIVPSISGRRYTLQSSTSLTGWSNEDESAVSVPGTGTPLALRDASPGTGRKFYRVLVSF